MNGLSEKINEILENHADNLRRYKEEEEKLINKLRFCSEHKFEEEERITMVKYNAISMMLYNYRDMFDEIQKAIDNWNS
jgi:hypothetical protein